MREFLKFVVAFYKLLLFIFVFVCLICFPFFIHMFLGVKHGDGLSVWFLTWLITIPVGAYMLFPVVEAIFNE